MKELTIVGIDGVVLAKFLVDVEGDNFTHYLTLPIFLPVISVTLLEIEKRENKRIREIIRRIKAKVEAEDVPQGSPALGKLHQHNEERQADLMKAEDTVMSDKQIGADIYGSENVQHWTPHTWDMPRKVAKAQAEISFKAGIREVVGWIEEHYFDEVFSDSMMDEWQAQLKEWGVKDG